MINLNIIAVGKLKENYLELAQLEYTKRLKTFCNINIIEVSEEKLISNFSEANINGVIKKEGARINAKLPSNSFTFALCIEGKMLDSPKLASKIAEIPLFGKSTINCIVGGSYGLCDSVKSLADFKLSMSTMTFPHQLARIMLLEQLYRAFSINANSKYHK